MPAPTVTAASPNIGSTQGGTNITLTGTNFTGTTGVTIGGVAATNVVVVSATSITCTTPAGTAGVGSILVTNGSGTNGANSLFWFLTATPTDTYVYLRGGRGDGFVPDWTGALTEEGEVDSSGAIVGTAGKEVSEPYRDIFDTSGNLVYSVSGASSASVPMVGGVLATGDLTITPPVGGVTPTGVIILPDAVEVTNSDEKLHLKPRQYYKVFTWLVFTSANGLAYKFRKADVVGIGSMPRT